MFKKIIFFICSILLLYGFFAPKKASFLTLASYKDFSPTSIECPGTLVLFDIDDTLITLENRLSLSWPFRIRLLWHFPELFNSQRWEQVYSQLWQRASFILIEPLVVDLINDLKSKGCMVFGLTSMESGAYGVIPSMPEWRYKTLVDFGIEFTQKFGNHTFTHFPAYRNNHPVLYKGILSANQQPKGKVLEAFLKHFNLHPQKIIFFEDSPENLQSVKETGKKLNIPAELYRYTGAEQFENWDADYMLDIIRKIIHSATPLKREA